MKQSKALSNLNGKERRANKRNVEKRGFMN
jgi:hypothetical protein